MIPTLCSEGHYISGFCNEVYAFLFFLNITNKMNIRMVFQLIKIILFYCKQQFIIFPPIHDTGNRIDLKTSRCLVGLSIDG